MQFRFSLPASAAIITLLLTPGSLLADTSDPALHASVDAQRVGAAHGLYPPVPEHSAIPQDPVRFCEAGSCTYIPMADALAKGYTLVDLGNDWTPTIFQHATSERTGRFLENKYRQRLIDLANDRVDIDGDPLDSWDQNYLELYGIPPTLAVLHKRWSRDHERDCWDDVDYDRIASFKGSIAFQRNDTDVWLRKRDRLAKQAAKSPGDVELAAQLADVTHKVDALVNVQKRILCEGLLSKWQAKKVRFGHAEWTTHHGIGQFEKKNRIFGWGHLRGFTTKRLGLRQDEVNFKSLKRVMEERIASEAGVVEDGSIDGQRNVLGEFTDAFFAALGIETAEQGWTWLDEAVTGKRLGIKIAYAAPEKPPYYSDHMDLSIEIDRGDVWYEYPYNDKGEKKRHKVRSRPTVTLYVRHEGKRIPMVRWGTTIGAWNKEQLPDGYVYMKYKNSDVGPRIMRHFIAAPVWIPPETTPVGELVKRKRIKGTRRSEVVVNYDEMGPGYKSAYGLAAGYLLEERSNRDGSKKWTVDHKIRIHGSANYMSIQRQNSHGCHRLHNHRAIRLYDFLRQHRKVRVTGEVVMDYEREFAYTPKGADEPKDFVLDIDSRGFRYQLDPPLPVNVLEGRVQGEEKEMLEHYFRIPGREYGEDAWIPEGGGPAVKPEGWIPKSERVEELVPGTEVVPGEVTHTGVAGPAAPPAPAAPAPTSPVPASED